MDALPTLPDTDDEGMNKERRELHGAVLNDIKRRVSWEGRQVQFYKMRHNGIARKQKPWNNAADLHFPLIDTNIEKLKPLYFQQIVSMDVVASFVPMQDQLSAATTTAEQWFDYKVRERSNLQEESLAWIDYALMGGRGVIKVMWSVEKHRLDYTAIDPMYLIVPGYTKEIQDSDRIVHVMPMSVAAYKRAGVYKSDEATMDRIKGTGEDKSDPGMTNLRTAQRTREGLTHDTNIDRVIVWEVYEKKAEGKWILSTFSPVAPEIDLRDPMELPYEHGMAPFVDFPYEIKDKGWYSPRGIAEILAAFEASLCHTWNQKHDAMQLFNKPVYTAAREIPNSMNLRVGPGQILPYGIAPAPMAQPPISFDTEMTTTRGIAEQRVANPDYGMDQVSSGSNRRTATEIQAIGAQSQQAGDLRARVFRMRLGQLYKMSWALLIQYDKEDLQYRFQDASLKVDLKALHEKYHIEPKGGVNEVNKQMLLQKAVARKEIFKNSPWINQAELDKSILELDDPSLIKRVFQDPDQKGKDEAEDETEKLPTFMLGNPIPAKPGLNFPVRIGVIMQFLQKAVAAKVQLPPFAIAAFTARLESLLQEDGKQDNNGAKQLGAMIQKFLHENGMIPQGMQPGAQNTSMPAPSGPAVASTAPVAQAPR